MTIKGTFFDGKVTLPQGIEHTTKPSKSWIDTFNKRLDNFVKNGDILILNSSENGVTFRIARRFSTSLSSAASLFAGVSLNGWLVWKDENDEPISKTIR